MDPESKQSIAMNWCFGAVKLTGKNQLHRSCCDAHLRLSRANALGLSCTVSHAKMSASSIAASPMQKGKLASILQPRYNHSAGVIASKFLQICNAKTELSLESTCPQPKTQHFFSQRIMMGCLCSVWWRILFYSYSRSNIPACRDRIRNISEAWKIWAIFTCRQRSIRAHVTQYYNQ